MSKAGSPFESAAICFLFGFLFVLAVLLIMGGFILGLPWGLAALAFVVGLACLIYRAQKLDRLDRLDRLDQEGSG